MNLASLLAKWRDSVANDPFLFLALGAALIAFATTPIAFAILGRRDWFTARRGRVLQRPEFSSIVCAMMLVMTIPAIFAALVVKSQSFDKNRYEFDPNKTWSVLEQGREYHSVKEADEAVKREMATLAEERKNLVNTVKKLDEAMLALRAVAGTSPAVAQAVPNVLQRLAAVRRSVGVDGPQQLMDFTAPPVDLASVPKTPTASQAVASVAPTASSASVGAPPVAAGLTQAEADAERAAVPEPQRALAAQLPLSDLPPGWTVGKSGSAHLETFNAENLFEKIDGRAESFLQYDVKGMAYTYFHPTDDDSNEIQLYIFEMASPLKALGKYGSEKPDEVKALPIGSEGYSAAGSTLFYAGRYYTQIVSTQDNPKFSAFALELARRIAATQTAETPATVVATTGRPGKVPSAAVVATPEAIFKLLPEGSGRANPKYVAQDVFGYSFLSDVFMADYEDKGATWGGFLRPYRDANEARAVFEKYVASVKQDGAEVKEIKAEGADRMVLSSNIGLNDVFFLKGNAIGGANGATDPKPAEAFARSFAKDLPAAVPAFESQPTPESGESSKEPG